MTELSYQLIERILPENTARIFIAYSGGVDSHVLLHLCATHVRNKREIIAVHIHHGLQQEADGWSEHCRSVTAGLSVGYLEIKVNAHPEKRQSGEEAARNARYAAMEVLLENNDVLLLAQHREDQLETVLLQLFRGAGIQGLAAMPVKMAFGSGAMLRPLLDCEKKMILQYARKHHLCWVEDPSNLKQDFDRNFLRNRIIPQLRQRWPSLDKTVSRSASHCAEAVRLLAAEVEELLPGIYEREQQTLRIASLMKLSADQRNLVLRHWFRLLGLRPPTKTSLDKILEEVIAARTDAGPELKTQACLIKRYQGMLYCVREEEVTGMIEQVWPKTLCELKSPGGRSLKRVNACSGIPVRFWDQATVMVKSRKGGESLSLPGRKGHHQLKKLFQEASVPPWQRRVMPLIYIDGQLAAVGGMWISSDFFSSGEEPCFQIIWK